MRNPSFWAVLGLASLLSAGCSGSSDEPSATATPAATPVASVTPQLPTATAEPTPSDSPAPPATATPPEASPTGTQASAGTETPGLSPTRDPSTTPSATDTPRTTPSPLIPPTPRGELAVAASVFVGVVNVIPDGPTVGGAPDMPAQYRVRDPAEVRVETLVTGLEVPWSLAFAPDGRLFVSERPGRIRIVSPEGDLDPTPWGTIAVRAVNESGLLGLTLSPDFATDPWVYVCYTYDADGAPRNRISRIRETDGRAGAEQILLDGIPGGTIHDGCRLKFGPDGKLYASMGEASQRARAQDLSSPLGKILRINPDGSIPADNPFGPSSPVYSYGHRNPQGLAFDPRSGMLFETEHGPSGEVGIGAHDEVNIIVAGKNYGWPEVIGAPGLAAYQDPLLAYPDRAVPPSGATFYASSRIPQWSGNFFFTSLGARHLQRIVLDDTRTRVISIERLFEEGPSQGRFGRLRDVVEGPDGALYVSTSNRDGRADPSPDDDRILRIVPSSE